MVIALLSTGRRDEAMEVATGLVEAAEATDNSYAISFALLATGMARSEVDPVGALGALRSGLVIAQESGNRANVSYIAMALTMTLYRIGGTLSDQLSALDNIKLAIRNYYDSGNVTQLRAALGLFLTSRAPRRSPTRGHPCRILVCEPHLRAIGHRVRSHRGSIREALGDQEYARLAREGEAMNMAAMATYAYDQIDQARRRTRTTTVSQWRH